jgi:hypothetical protein
MGISWTLIFFLKQIKTLNFSLCSVDYTKKERSLQNHFGGGFFEP